MDRRGFDHNPVAISLKEKRKKKKELRKGGKMDRLFDSLRICTRSGRESGVISGVDRSRGGQ